MKRNEVKIKIIKKKQHTFNLQSLRTKNLKMKYVKLKTEYVDQI